MTHCSVHTMSLQLEPANTVFIPAQVKQAASDIAVLAPIPHHRMHRPEHGAQIKEERIRNLSKHVHTLLRRSHNFSVLS